MSPVNASARYLAHLRAAWDDAHPDEPADEQEVLVTVPATFDAVARELTVVAAREAGLREDHAARGAAGRVLRVPRGARRRVAQGARRRRRRAGVRRRRRHHRLLADRGRATTAATSRSSASRSAITSCSAATTWISRSRALASSALADDGKTLDALQQRALVHACRAREGDAARRRRAEAVPIAILGRGSKLDRRHGRTELTRDAGRGAARRRLLPEGRAPTRRPSAAAPRGLREIGLPYAHDPAITRHLAEFLGRFGRMPTAVLFNGGVMKAAQLRARIVELLRAWAGRDVTRARRRRPRSRRRARRRALRPRAARQGRAHPRRHRARVLHRHRERDAGDPRVRAAGEGAVRRAAGARGGLDRRAARRRARAGGRRDRRRSGSSPPRPRGRRRRGRAGRRRRRPASPSSIRSRSSSPADGDRKAGELVPVRLEAHVTEVGTLELWCVARDGRGRWKLEYSVRERT